MLQITGLRYRYNNRPVLDGIHFNVDRGEIVSLVGPNGAGKSTLLKCVNRILKPGAREQVVFEGRPTADYSRCELARAMAYVPQQEGPALSLPVIDMITLGRAPHRGHSSRQRDREVVMAVLELAGLAPLAFRVFGELSGGERQRVLIARALAQEGRLVLLDEPTTALDLRHQLETMTLVRTIAREQGTAAIVAIHDPALASRFSDRLVMLSGGRIHAQGEWSAVLTPAHLQMVYVVDAVIGADGGLPYVIPTHLKHDRDRH
jgi:iron complex transport system ATP-binding protein